MIIENNNDNFTVLINIKIKDFEIKIDRYIKNNDHFCYSFKYYDCTNGSTYIYFSDNIDEIRKELTSFQLNTFGELAIKI